MNNQLSPEQEKAYLAILALADAIVDAVEAAGSHGAPGGALYAALVGRGISLGQFEHLMSTLVAIGKLRKSGNVYFAKGLK